MLSSPEGSEDDLRVEFERLLKNIQIGSVHISVNETSVSIINAYIVGSFYQVCPRTCNQAYVLITIFSVSQIVPSEFKLV